MKKLCVLVFLCLLALFARCSDNPVDEQKHDDDLDVVAADSIAQYWFQAIADTLVGLEHKDTDGIRETDVAAIRSGFDEALSRDSKNSIAHLGLSILGLLELNYSSSVWEVVDSIDAWGGRLGSPAPGGVRADRAHALIGRPFTLLAETPLAFSIAASRSIPPNLTIGHIQQIIKETIVPTLDGSIDHLAIVEQNTNASLMLEVRGDGATETVIIDLGEIYFFDAMLHALRAGFEFGIAYDCDLFGPDGTYGWIEDLTVFNADDDCAHYALSTGPSGDTLSLYGSYSSHAEDDSILLSVAHYNLADRPAYLTLLEDGSVVSAAGTDLETVVAKLEASVYFIKHVRTNETEANIIKLADLSELESGLGGGDAPNFAQGFATVEDVLEWAQAFLTGPVEFTEELGPRHETFTWTMDVSALLTNPVSDWKALLPYHRWTLPAGPWIERSTYLMWEGDNPSGEWQAHVEIGGVCQEWTFTDVIWVRDYVTYEEGMTGSVIAFLDGPGGNEIDLEVEHMPYFPDYTLHGLFPGMTTREQWIALLDVLN